MSIGDSAMSYAGKTLIGKVVDNADPLKLERVRVAIPEVYDPTAPVENLPWAIPKPSAVFGGTSTSGFFGVPVKDAIVYVEFQDGDPSFPMYVGYPVTPLTIKEEADENYPNRYGFRDEVGNVFIVDKTEGEQFFKWYDAAGNKVTFDQSGETLTVEHQSGLKINVDGSANLVISDATSIDLGADASEPLVMGNKLMNWLASQLKAAWADVHVHTGNLGAPTSPPLSPLNLGDMASGGAGYSTRNQTQN